MKSFLLLLLFALTTQVKVNDKAPYFFFDNVNKKVKEKDVKLRNLLKKNKYILISFASIHCKPCKKELPMLVEIYNQYKDRGITVVLITVDKDEELKKYIDFINSKDVPFPVAADFYTKNVVAKKYLGEDMSLPALFLVNSDRVIVKSWKGLRKEVKTELEKIFSKLEPAKSPEKTKNNNEKPKKTGFVDSIFTIVTNSLDQIAK